MLMDWKLRDCVPALRNYRQFQHSGGTKENYFDQQQEDYLANLLNNDVLSNNFNTQYLI